MSGGWQLGPNHRDYRRPLGRPSTARVQAPEGPESGHYTLPQLIREYAALHDRQAGGPCRCILCADLRWHEEQVRLRKRAGGRS